MGSLKLVPRRVGDQLSKEAHESALLKKHSYRLEIISVNSSRYSEFMVDCPGDGQEKAVQEICSSLISQCICVIR